MSDVALTELIQRWTHGDAGALDALLPFVYADLRRLADQQLRSNHGHDTLQPTALIHDVFLRFLGNSTPQFVDRKHFFTMAAKTMRQILIDRLRAQQRDKRGGDWQRVPFLEALALPIDHDVDLFALDQALSALQKLDARVAEVVELRYFGGLEVHEVATLLDVDERTVYRDFAMARAWLRQALS